MFRKAILEFTQGKPLLETEEGVYYLDYDSSTNELFMGSACNVGILKEYAIPYDNDETIETNILNLMALIQE